MDDRRLKTLYTQETIQARVQELGRQIRDDFPGGPVTCVAVLKSAFIFVADLVRAIDGPVRVEFLGVAPYHGGVRGSGAMQIIQDLTRPLEGQDCVLVKEIVDSPASLDYLVRLVRLKNPRTLKVCALLARENLDPKKVPLDYVGFRIPDEFVVGYGMDLAELYRNLPSIAVYAP